MDRFQSLLALKFFLFVLAGAACAFIPPPAGDETVSIDFDKMMGKPGGAAAKEEGLSPADSGFAAAQASSGEDSYQEKRRPRLQARADSCERESEGHRCRKRCSKIYRWRQDGAKCRRLDPDQIEDLESVYKTLASPKNSALNEIEIDDFEVYFQISAASFSRLIRGYNSDQAGKVLEWIAESRGAAELTADEDIHENYRILHSLLKALSPSFDEDDPHIPFSLANLDDRGNKQLMKTALNSRNEPAAEWFFYYIMDKTPDCRKNDRAGRESCFRVFCRIGDSMNRGLRKAWMKHDFFESYIDGVVRHGVNGRAEPPSDKWDIDEIESLNDISDWFTDLKCANLV